MIFLGISKKSLIYFKNQSEKRKNVYRLLELVSMLPWSKILKLNSKEFLHLLDTGLQSTLKVHKNKSCFDIVLNTVLIVSFN